LTYLWFWHTLDGCSKWAVDWLIVHSPSSNFHRSRGLREALERDAQRSTVSRKGRLLKSKLLLASALPAILLIAGFENWTSQNGEDSTLHLDKEFGEHIARTAVEGRRTFRFDTFGDEAFWGGELRLHQAIAGTRFGGVGPGLSPRNALALGLKVDQDAIPPVLITELKQGRLNLDDPAVTLELLRLNAVVGLTGFSDSQGKLRSVGIQCALCHSVVDNAVASGIGHRLDGWANRDLNVGAIINLAPGSWRNRYAPRRQSDGCTHRARCLGSRKVRRRAFARW